MAQHTIDCACVADTYVDKINPNTNYGSATALKINNYDAVANGGYGNSRALLKFDIPSSILRKRILSVILSIHITTGSDTHTVYVRSFKLSWEENTVTFNTALNMIDNYVLMPDNSIIYPNKWSNIPLLLEIIQQRLEDVLNYGLEIFCTFESGYGAEAFIDSRSVSGYEPKLTIVYEDVPPDAPTPIDPVGTYKDSNQAIRFQWRYNSSVGGTQKAFDLQWSTDQSTWTTISQTTANTYYDMPAGTFPVDNVYWRVKCYNELDEASPYSNIASFYAVGAPAAPVINAVPTNSARPTVSWSAFSQQIYQLQVLSGDTIVYDSGIVPGINIRQHKIKAWLEDGKYTIRLRIKNEYDLWSEWGSATVTISTVKPEKPSVNLQRSAIGIELHIEGIADYALIFRADYDTDDYICIGKTTSATYVDNSVRNKGEYKYFIRSVSADETFEDSDIKFAQAEFQYSLLAPVSDLSKVFVFTRSLNAPPKRTYSHQLGGAFVEYVGRKHPVWEPTEHASAGWSMTFFLKTWIDVERFEAIYNLNSTVLYRDSKGRKMYGILSNLSVNDERTGYTVSFVINQVDYNEGLEV